MLTFECYVISLARTPERLAEFTERNAATGLTFRTFAAIDGATLDRDACIANGLIRSGAQHYTNGTLGAASSHRALWSHAVAARTPLLIFEDDVHCRHDILVQLERVTARLPEWDILLLGYNTDAVLQIKLLPYCSLGGFFSKPYPSQKDLADFVRVQNDVGVYPLKNAFGMCSYLVSPQGAEKLLEKVFPLDNRDVRIPYNELLYGRTRFACVTLDMNVNTVYRHIRAHAVVPPLALPPNDKTTSSTRPLRAAMSR